jgi:TonB family protein
MKRKLKIMKSRPEVTDSEIQQFMDFEKLLDEKNRLTRTAARTRIVRNTTLGILAVGLVATVLLVGNEKQDYTPDTTSQETERIQQAPLDAASAENDQAVSATRGEITTDEASANKKEIPQIESGNEKLPQKNDKRAISRPSAKEVTSPVYVQAEPLNGYPALYEYFDRELKYPQQALRDSVEGIVTVIFTIDIQGKPSNIQIENSLGKAFDDEVFRVIETMPVWKPASYNDQPVPSKISLPLTFELNKDAKN